MQFDSGKPLSRAGRGLGPATDFPNRVPLGPWWLWETSVHRRPEICVDTERRLAERALFDLVELDRDPAFRAMSTGSKTHGRIVISATPCVMLCMPPVFQGRKLWDHLTSTATMRAITAGGPSVNVNGTEIPATPIWVIQKMTRTRCSRCSRMVVQQMLRILSLKRPLVGGQREPLLHRLDHAHVPFVAHLADGRTSTVEPHLERRAR